MIKKLLQHIITIITLIIILCLVGSSLTAYISPKYLHFLAFAGFLFPVFWVLNLAMVIFNLANKNYKLFIGGIILCVITLGQISDIYQFGVFSRSDQNDKGVIKVMSFNTRMFDYYGWTGEKNVNEKVFDFIRQENPDIVCFQEFFSYSRKPQFAEHHIISRLNQFPYHHIEYNVTGKNGKRFGQATFSKFPIQLKKALIFENTSNFSIQTDIRVKDKTIRVFNNHLESVRLKTQHYNFLDSINLKSEKETKAGLIEIFSKLNYALNQRVTQSKTVARHIKNSPYPAIVCGDFNDTPISYVYRTMRGSLKDSYKEAGSGFQGTYNGKLPSFRIDFIFHDAQFSAQEFKTFKKNFSDHYPIMATIKL